MNANSYQVIINNEASSIAGSLIISAPDTQQIVVPFDPTTVLCDLLDTVDYEAQYDNESDNYFVNTAYFEHPFSAIELPDDFFESQFHSHVKFSWFYDFMVELKELCEEKRNLSLNQFEVFRQYFNAQFTYKIEFQKNNPFFQQHLFCEMEGIDSSLADLPYIYQTLDENQDFTINEMLDFYADTPFRHNYSCHALVDVVCAVWHYLILHEYKFNRCNHCGKYFATQTLKKLYCDRKSPYPSFEQHNCEQAVRNIKQKLARRKKSAYTYLSAYYSGGVNLFLEQHAQLKDAVDSCSSVGNLKALEDFLSKETVRKAWYRDEYK